LLVGLVGLVAIFQAVDLGRFPTLASIRSSQVDLEAWHQAQPLFTGAIFFAGYVAVAALSLPGFWSPSAARPISPATACRNWAWSPAAQWKSMATCRPTSPTSMRPARSRGPYQFTHTASHQAWYATVNALLAPFKKFRADYRVIPWATFVEPEVARVGLNETQAKERNVPYEVTGKDRILGVTIVGEHAGDLLAEYVLAMKHGLGLNKILGTIHTYPTLAEANKYAAGEWKRAHATQALLAWVERFHGWRRGDQERT
jgi:hypothetical protein